MLEHDKLVRLDGEMFFPFRNYNFFELIVLPKNNLACMLQDMGKGRNKTNDNPANSAQGAKTSSGECICTRTTSMLIDTTNNSQQDKVLRSTHTERTSSH